MSPRSTSSLCKTQYFKTRKRWRKGCIVFRRCAYFLNQLKVCSHTDVLRLPSRRARRLMK